MRSQFRVSVLLNSQFEISATVFHVISLAFIPSMIFSFNDLILFPEQEDECPSVMRPERDAALALHVVVSVYGGET